MHAYLLPLRLNPLAPLCHCFLTVFPQAACSYLPLANRFYWVVYMLLHYCHHHHCCCWHFHCCNCHSLHTIWVALPLPVRCCFGHFCVICIWQTWQIVLFQLYTHTYCCRRHCCCYIFVALKCAIHADCFFGQLMKCLGRLLWFCFCCFCCAAAVVVNITVILYTFMLLLLHAYVVHGKWPAIMLLIYSLTTFPTKYRGASVLCCCFMVVLRIYWCILCMWLKLWI